MINKLIYEGENGKNTLDALVNELIQSHENLQSDGKSSQAAQRKTEFKRLFKKHRALFHSDDALWGRAGYGLTCFAMTKQAVEWLSEYRNRSNIETWTLHNLAEGLISQKRFDEARTVCHDALQRRQNAGMFTAFSALTAFLDSCADNHDAAEELLGYIDRESMKGGDTIYFDLAQIVIQAKRQSVEGRSSWKTDAKERIREAFGDFLPVQYPVEIRKCYWRCVNAIGEQSGQGGVKVWASWNYLRWRWIGVILMVLLTPILLLLPPIGWILLAYVWTRLFN